MDDLVIYTNQLSYKYRLLLCLLNEYYLTATMNNSRKNSKVLICAHDTSILMEQYNDLFDTINNFKNDDIKTLKIFLCRDKKVKEMFKYFDENNITYKSLVLDLKKMFNKESRYYYNDYEYNTNPLRKDKNIVFIKYTDIPKIYDKYTIRSVFSLCFVSGLKDVQFRRFTEAIKSICVKHIEVKEILKNEGNKHINNELYVYVRCSDDTCCDIEQEVYESIQRYKGCDDY